MSVGQAARQAHCCVLVQNVHSKVHILHPSKHIIDEAHLKPRVKPRLVLKKLKGV